MRILICLVMVINFLVIVMPGAPYCYASATKQEMEWDFFKPMASSRDLNTVSLHILDKISENKGRSVHRGITITRAQGNIIPNRQTQVGDSSAVGLGLVYMVRNEEFRAGKFSAVVDMSGGFIVYDKKFPTGGEYYNFMWRIGPRLIYKFTPNSSINIGYMLMHVSNGLHSEVRNPSYNARGISVGMETKF